MSHKTFFLVLVVLCIVSLFTYQGKTYADETALTPRKAAQQLADHLRELDSLSFSFTQETQGQMSGRPRQASGRAFFAKQDGTALMRWDYDTPDRQVILSDGTTLTMYFSSLNQMIIAPAEKLQQDVTYSFFSGSGNIDDTFIIQGEEEAGRYDGNHLNSPIQLIPRAPNAQTQSIKLWFSDSNQIHTLEIRDNFDTITRLSLNNIEENSLTVEGKLLDETLFQFTPPPDTEILNQE
ncbi:MAG: outer membrane lipoprotein carrier protein LolA [Desulfopila sp.]|jgi:outer membrane lipoprotein carrier protein|nr:outer membrane lipoprotein carrier protein LolA [Desulfopila sp.]